MTGCIPVRRLLANVKLHQRRAAYPGLNRVLSCCCFLSSCRLHLIQGVVVGAHTCACREWVLLHDAYRLQNPESTQIAKTLDLKCIHDLEESAGQPLWAGL